MIENYVGVGMNQIVTSTVEIIDNDDVLTKTSC